MIKATFSGTGLNRNRGRGVGKPWNQRRKQTSRDKFMDWNDMDEAEQRAHEAANQGKFFKGNPEGLNQKVVLFAGQDAPCVGLCYYNKLLGLENKYEDQNSPNSVIEVTLFLVPFLRRKKTDRKKMRLAFFKHIALAIRNRF